MVRLGFRSAMSTPLPLKKKALEVAPNPATNASAITQLPEINNDKSTDDTNKGFHGTYDKNNNDGSFDFALDTQAIDTKIIKRISINRTINAIVVEVNKGSISTTINLEDFSEKTIKPLKRDLAQLLKDNKNKQTVIHSIVTCILGNIDKSEASQGR
jgi:hypothetical protein